MKKFFMTFAIVAVFALTGCGKSEKTLTCTQSEDDTKATVNLTFKKDKMTKVDMVVDIDISGEDYSEEDLAYLNEMFGIACIAYTGDGVDCNTNVTAKAATMKVVIDVEKASSSTLKELELEETYTYQKAKDELTADGYTCK